MALDWVVSGHTYSGGDDRPRETEEVNRATVAPIGTGGGSTKPDNLRPDPQPAWASRNWLDDRFLIFQPAGQSTIFLLFLSK